VPTFVWKAIQGLPIPLENEGLASRDFIYVDDICEGLIACALNGATGQSYNLASGSETSIRELAELIVQIAESKSSVIQMPARSWDNSGHRFGSTQKASIELGFSASTELASGLRRTVEWTKENAKSISDSITRHSVFDRDKDLRN
jgi:nucleoside-diphosphate-sugar epimerase